METGMSITRSVKRALLVVLLAAGLVYPMPPGAEAQPAGYAFTQIAALGDPAPGGGSFTFDFEPGGINNRGETAFAADVTTGGEGVFLGGNRAVSQIARSGQPAPGGGTFGIGVTGVTALNETGDLAVAFFLDPFMLPLGLNIGVYRFSQVDQTLSAVMAPGVTPAPGGGVFQGTLTHYNLNNRGEIAFAGIVPTTAGISGNLGMGVFLADKEGQISSVVSPGDPAPGGSTFDFAENAWINDGGDVAFGAHVAGEECIDFGVPQTDRIFCAESVYVMKAATGEIESIAHQGDPAPGGGTYRLAFGPVLNNQGDIVFIGDLTPAPGFGEALGVFLFSKGSTIPVARPGDPMPGGGHLRTAAFIVGTYDINNPGEVSFLGALDTDVNGDGVADTGLFVWSHGTLRLVARTGTVIPGVGTVAHVNNPGYVPPVPLSFFFNGADLNDRGQVFTSAILADGKVVLLVATPSR